MLHKKNIKKVIATWMAVVVSVSCLTVNVSATEVSSANAIDGNVTTDTTTVTPTVVPTATETIPNAVDASVMPVATREGDPAKMVAGYSMDPYSYFSEEEWEQMANKNNKTDWDHWTIPALLDSSPYHFRYGYKIYMDFTSQAYRKNGKKVKKLNVNQDSYNNLMKYGLVKGDYVTVDIDTYMKTSDSYLIAITKEEFDALQNDLRNRYIDTYGEDPSVKGSYISDQGLYDFSWDFGKVLFCGSNPVYISKWDTENKIAYGGKPDKIYYYKILYLDRTIKRSDRPDDPHFKGVTFQYGKYMHGVLPTSKYAKVKELINKDGLYRAKFTVKKLYTWRNWISFDHKTYYLEGDLDIPIKGYYSNGKTLDNTSYSIYYDFKPNITKWEKRHLKHGKNRPDIDIYCDTIPQKYKDMIYKSYLIKTGQK